MVLTEKECDKLNSKILQVFKNKINLLTTTPNCIIFSDFGYKLFNIWDKQLLLHGTNLYNRINEHNLSNKTTIIRLQQLQNLYWSHTSILEDKFLFSTKKNTNLTNEIFNILKIQGITFQLSHHSHLGTLTTKNLTPISSIMSTFWYKTNRHILRKRQIFYIEQFLNDNKTRMLTWQQIRNKLGRQGRTPAWYNDLRQTTCTFPLEDKYELNPNIIDNSTPNPFKT